MTLPIDEYSEDYRFRKTLNMDVKLETPFDKSKHYDIVVENDDYCNVTGHDSLYNAIVIAIMTRFQELNHNSLYGDFGCRAHEYVKARKTEMVQYSIEVYILDVLEKMRRIQEINWLTVTDTDEGYRVEFNVTSVTDEIVSGSVDL